MTKAQQVRELILAAKAEGKSAETLIGAVMEQFGFGRQLARTYIKNNWGKVEAPIVLMQEAVVPAKQGKVLSMSKDAIRKREKRAAAKAAAVAA